jgi:hypothetical protein
MRGRLSWRSLSLPEQIPDDCERRKEPHAHDRAAADAVQFLASMTPAFLIRVRPRGCQTSASLLMITTRASVGAYSGRPPRQLCSPEPVAQFDQFAKLSNESRRRPTAVQGTSSGILKLNPPSTSMFAPNMRRLCKALRTGVRDHPFPIKQRPDRHHQLSL